MVKKIGKSFIVFILIWILIILFGIIHNLISYEISSELYEHLFFIQFGFGEYFNSNPRLTVTIIAIIACISIGFIFALIYALIVFFFRLNWYQITEIISIHLGITLLFSVLGLIYGYLFLDSSKYLMVLNISEIQSFDSTNAGLGMHNGTYIGGVLGLIISFIWVLKKITTSK